MIVHGMWIDFQVARALVSEQPQRAPGIAPIVVFHLADERHIARGHDIRRCKFTTDQDRRGAHPTRETAAPPVGRDEQMREMHDDFAITRDCRVIAYRGNLRAGAHEQDLIAERIGFAQPRGNHVAGFHFMCSAELLPQCSVCGFKKRIVARVNPRPCELRGVNGCRFSVAGCEQVGRQQRGVHA